MAMNTRGWTRRRFLGGAVAMAAAGVGAGGSNEPVRDRPAVATDRRAASGYPRIDLRKDCGAVGDGVTNDTAAIQKAAEIIQQAGGGELIIPSGVYVVGRQRVKADSTAAGSYYEAADLFKVRDLAHLRIRGHGAVLRISAGLHYGGFDPRSGKPLDARGGAANAARVGRIIEITHSTDIVIEGLELDGSNESLILGGQWGDVDRQAAAAGIWVNGCDHVRISDVHTHHHALDGIAVLHLDGPPPRRMPHRLDRVVSEYNGRQGLSWIGGWGLECTDCKFNHTGRAINHGQPFMSKPRAGLDIEPNARTTQKSREGVFVRCEFVDNAGAGVVASAGDGGYSTFIDCTLWGTTNYSLYVTRPGMKFARCRIHGTAIHASDGRTEPSSHPDAGLATSFEDCTFEDKEWTNGAVFRNHNLYTLSRGAAGARWRRCTFTSHRVRGVHIGDPQTEEWFASCTFIHGHAGLPAGTHQSSFEGSRLSGCHFTETAEVANGGREYFIKLSNVKVDASAPGDPPTRVDGPKVKWGDASRGATGNIAPATFR